MPRISVLLPVREAEAFLEEAARSVLKQTFRDFELLLLYSASKDTTLALCEAIADSDGRVRLLETAGPNLAAGLNAGLRAAGGELVARMDADDVALPERFARQAAAFDIRPGLGLLGSAVRYIDARGRKGRLLIQPAGADIRRAFCWGSPFTHPAVMMRRAVLEVCGGYRQLFSQAEDYDLWLRLDGATEMDNLPETLLLYRLHNGNSIRRKAPEIRRYAFFAQAAWLARQKNGHDPLAGLTALPDPESLPLTQDELAGLYGRVLAGSAHLLGDARDDPEGGLWWPWIDRIADRRLRREVRFFCAMRSARFYGPRSPLRCLGHMARAAAASPCRAAGYGLRLLSSLPRKLKVLLLE